MKHLIQNLMGSEFIRFRIMIVLFSVAFFPLVPQESTAQVGWQSASSVLMEYTIPFPLHWDAAVTHLKEQAPKYVILEEISFWDGLGADITVAVWKDDSKGSIAEWINSHYAIIGHKASEMKKTKATFEKLPALSRSEEYCGVGCPDTETTFFKKDDKIFRINYSKNDQGMAQDVYMYMMDNLRFEVTGDYMLYAKIDGFAYTPGTAMGFESAGESMISITAATSCGGETHQNKCKRNNPCMCCGDYCNCQSSFGNCTWWAWESACRNWSNWGMSACGDAKKWPAALLSYGLKKSSSPKTNSIAVSTTLSKWGHVAWVKEVNGSTVIVSEQNYCVAGTNYSKSRSASTFDGGFWTWGIELTDASVRSDADGLLLVWNVKKEPSYIGMNVYRSVDGSPIYERVNRELILANQTSYSYKDTASKPYSAHCNYKIETVGLDGSVHMYGPISVSRSYAEAM